MFYGFELFGNFEVTGCSVTYGNSERESWISFPMAPIPARCCRHQRCLYNTTLQVVAHIHRMSRMFLLRINARRLFTVLLGLLSSRSSLRAQPAIIGNVDTSQVLPG